VPWVTPRLLLTKPGWSLQKIGPGFDLGDCLQRKVRVKSTSPDVVEFMINGLDPISQALIGRDKDLKLVFRGVGNSLESRRIECKKRDAESTMPDGEGFTVSALPRNTQRVCSNKYADNAVNGRIWLNKAYHNSFVSPDCRLVKAL
jgi:hypothetical protein